jgi:hypothetical protein
LKTGKQKGIFSLKTKSILLENSEKEEREREVANLHTKQLPPNPVVDGGVASAWAVSWPRRPGVLDISEGTTGVVGRDYRALGGGLIGMRQQVKLPMHHGDMFALTASDLVGREQDQEHQEKGYFAQLTSAEHSVMLRLLASSEKGE